MMEREELRFYIDQAKTAILEAYEYTGYVVQAGHSIYYPDFSGSPLTRRMAIEELIIERKLEPLVEIPEFRLMDETYLGTPETVQTFKKYLPIPPHRKAWSLSIDERETCFVRDWAEYCNQ